MAENNAEKKIILTEIDNAALREHFRHMDRDNSGYLDHNEIKDGLRELNYLYSDTEIDEIIKSVDDNNNGQVEYEGKFTKTRKQALSFGIIKFMDFGFCGSNLKSVLEFKTVRKIITFKVRNRCRIVFCTCRVLVQA
jgi:hypothetical protein